MIHEFKKPIPCITPLGDAYAIYCTSNGMFENDEWACAMMEDGQVRHFNTAQIKLWHNGTYDICKPLTNEKEKSKATKKTR